MSEFSISVLCVFVLLFLYRAACTYVSAAVISVVRLAYAHALRCTGVYETKIVAGAVNFGYNAYVSYALVNCSSVKKNEISRTQFVAFDLFSVVDLLV